MSKHIKAKLGNMKKVKEWCVYPRQTGETQLIIQTSDRIALFNPENGKGILSKAVGHPGFVFLNPALGATYIQVPQDVIDAAVKAQPRGGDQIGPGVYVAPEVEPLDVLAQIKSDVGSENVAECPEIVIPDELTEITSKIEQEESA